MENNETAIPGQRGTRARNGSVTGVLSALPRALVVCQRLSLQVALTTVGLIGLAIVVADIAGWMPLMGSEGQDSVVRPLAEPLQDNVALSSRSGSGESSGRDGIDYILKTPQPEPTPTPRSHIVTAGENLLGIAAAYGVLPERIAEANDLWDPNRLRIGQVLLIPPSGYIAHPASKEKPGELRLWWPLQGEITTDFGEESSYYIGGTHTGIDIAANTGIPVHAAAAGKVVVAWKRPDNVGWHIIVEHGGGFSTLYGHLSRFFVEEGDLVERGEVVGAVGDTGFSLGPHLHFEVRRWGTPVDPLEYLP